MEYTCPDCTEVYKSIQELAEHCKETGHYDEEVDFYLKEHIDG